VDDVINKMGLSDEDLDGLTGEMMNALSGVEELTRVDDADSGSDDDGKTATFPFLNRLFGGGNSCADNAPPPAQDRPNGGTQSAPKNGGKRRGVLQSENKLANDELKRLKVAWEDMYSSDGDKALILNNGVKFSEISQTAVEQQLAEQKKEINNEICALFGLNTDVISSKASDDERIAAIKTAIMPILTAFTKSANKELLLESEKYAPEGDMYFEFDLSESMKADMLKRFQAYEIALRSKWLQPDEVRYKEDLDPLGLDFITLGLDDVLYDPKTKTVYTPNTNQTTKLGEGGVKIDEERFNPNHGADGKFISGGGTKHAPDLGGGIGGGNSGNGIDKANKSDIMNKKAKMGKSEVERLSHEIATTYPNLKPNDMGCISNRNHFYVFNTVETGTYRFHLKIKIVGNEKQIFLIRKGLSE
jgi:hypothetical protein